MGDFFVDIILLLLVGVGGYAVVREYRTKVAVQDSLDRARLERFLVRSVPSSEWDDAAGAEVEVELSREGSPSTFVTKITLPPHWLTRIQPGVALYGRWLAEHERFVPDWSVSTETYDAHNTRYRDRS